MSQKQNGSKRRSLTRTQRRLFKGRYVRIGWSPEIQALFKKYNREYFGNKLSHDIKVFVASLHQALGLTIEQFGKEGKIAIFLDPHTLKVGQHMKMTLLHEMAHAKLLGRGYAGHGRRFQREMHRLADEGAFEGLW